MWWYCSPSKRPTINFEFISVLTVLCKYVPNEIALFVAVWYLHFGFTDTDRWFSFCFSSFVCALLCVAISNYNSNTSRFSFFSHTFYQTECLWARFPFISVWVWAFLVDIRFTNRSIYTHRASCHYHSSFMESYMKLWGSFYSFCLFSSVVISILIHHSFIPLFFHLERKKKSSFPLFIYFAIRFCFLYHCLHSEYHNQFKFGFIFSFFHFLWFFLFFSALLYFNDDNRASTFFFAMFLFLFYLVMSVSIWIKWHLLTISRRKYLWENLKRHNVRLIIFRNIQKDKNSFRYTYIPKSNAISQRSYFFSYAKHTFQWWYSTIGDNIKFQIIINNL